MRINSMSRVLLIIVSSAMLFISPLCSVSAMLAQQERLPEQSVDLSSNQAEKADKPIEGSSCASPPVDEVAKEEVERALRRFRQNNVEANSLPGPVTIPVYFHVIYQGSGMANGDVSEATLDTQIRVLNDSFSGMTGGANTSFRFVKAGTDRTYSPRWFNMPTPSSFASQEEVAAKSVLRRGGATALNFYTVGGLNPDGPAWATFPWDYSGAPCLDGVVVRVTMLPGGVRLDRRDFNKGDIGTHEVGHWLGLYHTFQGGCSGNGDEVADTPAHTQPAAAVGGCDRQDSCVMGVDAPIHNFMQDSSDTCKFEFTPGQSERMGNMYVMLRQSNVTAPQCPYFEGTVDAADCSIRGWAADRRRLNTPITVTVIWPTFTGVIRDTVLANGQRPDVGAYLGDNGLHGFSIPVPDYLRDGFPHDVQLRFETSIIELNGSPARVNCSALVPFYAGWVDIADCNSIIGWAADRNRLNTPITVRIFDDTTLISTLTANQLRSDVGAYLEDNGIHGFGIATPDRFKDGLPHTLRVKFESTATEVGGSPRTIRCGTPPTASVAWVKPAEFSWGPTNTMTVAGYAQGGSGGGVQMVWRDVTINGSWNVVSWQPTPNPADNTWSNTIPSSNRCHRYSVYVNYSGIQSPVFTYVGVNSGYCSESARVIWIQPQSTAGFGPPGSLVVAGSATNAPSGTQVYLWYRDVTVGSGWTRLDFAPLPGSDGIWYNAIPNADPFHQYQVYVTYDAFTSGTCTYAGNNAISWCP